jgi:hypothetical protein
MTRELRDVLEQQRAITENLQRQLNVVCPRMFHRSGRPFKSFRIAFRSAPARRLDWMPRSCPTDFAEPPVCNLVRAGIPGLVAIQMTGHTTRSVFERYNMRAVGDLREAARRFDTRAGRFQGTIEQDRQSDSRS